MKYGKKYGKYFTPVNFVALFSFVVCVIAGVMSYSTHITSQRTEEKYMHKLEILQHEIDRLNSRFATLAGSSVASEGRGSVQTKVPTVQPPQKTVKGMDSKSADKPAISYHDELMRLKQIIDLSGLEQLTEEGDVDLSFLKEMSDRRVERQKLESHRRDLMERNSELLLVDEEKYDEEMQALYEKARLRRGIDPNDKELESSFNEMLEQYPDAYATAILIAERALVSVFRRDVPKVEEYHDMLLSSENENFLNVVTNQGFEAMPAIEHYLVRQYIKQGRTEEAESLIDSLEQNYPDSLLLTGRRGRRGPSFQPASEVVPGLRSLAERGQ